MSNSAPTNPKKSSVNFTHRLSGSNKNHECDPIDSIGLMTARALGVLYLLLVQFEDSNECRLSDLNICGAIDSVIQEVDDIKATILALAEAEHAETAKNRYKKTD